MLCAALWEKIKDDFSLAQDTRKINWGFSLDRLFECYNHIELKYYEEFQSSILEQVDIFLELGIRELDKMRSSTFQC